LQRSIAAAEVPDTTGTAVSRQLVSSVASRVFRNLRAPL